MATIGSLAVNLIANSQGLSQGLAKAQDHVRHFESSLSRVSIGSLLGSGLDTVQSGLSSIISTGTKAAAIFGVVGAAGAGWALKVASEMEDARASLDFFIGDADRSAALFKDLEALALRTPFRSRDLIGFAGKLKSVDLETDKITPLLEAVATQAAAKGGDPSLITKAITDVLSKGTLQGQEKLQFGNQGINIVKVVSDYWNQSMKATLEMMEKGLVDAGTVVDALIADSVSGSTAGFLPKAQNRFSQLMATFAEQADITAGHIGEALIRGFDLKGALRSGAATLEGVAKQAAGLVPVFTEIKQTAARMLTPVIESGRAAWSIIQRFAAEVQSLGPKWAAYAAVQSEAFSAAIKAAAGLGDVILRVGAFAIEYLAKPLMIAAREIFSLLAQMGDAAREMADLTGSETLTAMADSFARGNEAIAKSTDLIIGLGDAAARIAKDSPFEKIRQGIEGISAAAASPSLSRAPESFRQLLASLVGGKMLNQATMIGKAWFGAVEGIATGIGKMGNDLHGQLQGEAMALIESLKTPAEIFEAQVARINMMTSLGLLTAEQRVAAIEKLAGKTKDQFAALPAAFEQGTREAYSAVVKFQMGDQGRNELPDLLAKNNQQNNENLAKLSRLENLLRELIRAQTGFDVANF